MVSASPKHIQTSSQANAYSTNADGLVVPEGDIAHVSTFGLREEKLDTRC